MLAYLRRDYVRSRAYARQLLAQSPGDRGAAFVLALADGQLDRRKAERELVALLSYYESEDRDWPPAARHESATALAWLARWLRAT